MSRKTTGKKTTATGVAILAFNYAFAAVTAGNYIESIPGFVVGLAAMYVGWRFQELEVPMDGKEITARLRETGESLDEFVTNSTQSRPIDAEDAAGRFDTSDYQAFHGDCTEQTDLGASQCSELWKAVQDLDNDDSS